MGFGDTCLENCESFLITKQGFVQPPQEVKYVITTKTADGREVAYGISTLENPLAVGESPNLVLFQDMINLYESSNAVQDTHLVGNEIHVLASTEDLLSEMPSGEIFVEVSRRDHLDLKWQQYQNELDLLKV